MMGRDACVDCDLEILCGKNRRIQPEPDSEVQSPQGDQFDLVRLDQFLRISWGCEVPRKNSFALRFALPEKVPPRAWSPSLEALSTNISTCTKTHALHLSIRSSCLPHRCALNS